jgi:glutaredoxin-related protein
MMMNNAMKEDYERIRVLKNDEIRAELTKLGV